MNYSEGEFECMVFTCTLLFDCIELCCTVRVLYSTPLYCTVLCAMSGDLFGDQRRENPPGSTNGSHGSSSVDRGSRVAPPSEKDSGLDLIVEVKVKSEFIDDYSSPFQGEAYLVNTETFQSNFLQTSQDVLSDECVKQEPCDSSPMEPSKASQLLQEKQRKQVSCFNCSRLFNADVFVQQTTRSISQEPGTFGSMSNNRSCKHCAEALEDIQQSERPHQCYVCDRSFSTSSSFKEHQKIHIGEKPYKCYLCPKAFAHSSHLNNHQRMHTRAKLHKCSMCNKAFNLISELKMHQVIHSNQKPLKCAICNKEFPRSSYLYEHQRMHRGEKLHKCSLCSKAFDRISSLKKHPKNARQC
uniref:C2H2-type domain-containing protein n=1 Tax=Eptatretus burgeri TaxID=7764 RepID=A0A8C4NJQ6_EPTBU